MIKGCEMWALTGERCRSSETLFTYCSGIDALGDHGEAFPMSVDDFRRCRLVLELCPHLQLRMKRLAYISKEWAELVSFWDDVCMIHDLEAPNWRKHAGAARRTKKMLREILKRVNPSLFEED